MLKNVRSLSNFFFHLILTEITQHTVSINNNKSKTLNNNFCLQKNVYKFMGQWCN